MLSNYLGNIIKRFLKLGEAISNWASYQNALSSFAYFGRNISWHSHIGWMGPKSISVGDNCTIKNNVRIYSGELGREQITLSSDVVVLENVLLDAKRGRIEIGENSTIGENVRIIASDGFVSIGKNVTIGRDTEVIANDGDIILGDDVFIDLKCWLHGNGERVSETEIRRGQIDLGCKTYIGYGSMIEANGGYVRTENDVKIDYQNIVGGKGGVYFEAKSHLRHSNYVDAFKEEIRLGEHITIGQKCIIAGRGAIRIGAKSLIGGLTFIVSENHKAELFDIPYRYQGHDYEGITLEENVWIGGQTLIIDGVTIGTGTLVGGGAVVVNDLEPWSFAVGVPAQRIRDIREQ